MADYAKTLLTDFTKELNRICNEFDKVSSLTIGIANHCEEHNSSQSESTSTDAIMNELKLLSSTVNALKSDLTPTVSTPNLMDELSSEPVIHPELTRNDLDEASAENDTTTCNFNINRRYNNNNFNNKNNNTSNNNFINKRHNNNDISRKMVNRSKNNNFNGNNDNNHNHNRMNHNDRNSFMNRNKCGNNSNKNVNHNAHNHNHNRNGFLPPYKDLLTAAKAMFSGPVKNRGINFQRGETLNPSHDSSSSPNWAFGPALRSSFTNHCSSCSCQQTGF
ncbi:uncharacterized protein DDB_G0292186-like [Armigeres subalbatus]|uniref:uncharacterized protein DDB_G0292186-like n=1 Tax=Armigeres subalbatus TaxID=124917 RepID=UPI002ECFB999